jgi:DNA-binding response OmpR family regulator
MLNKKEPKILAIEDNHVFLRTLLDLLKKNGLGAIGTPTGWLGLQLAKEQMLDLIICNVSLPGLNGYEVLKALRQDSVTQKIPFIFLTAEHTDIDRLYAKELGANDYLDKFCKPGELIRVIKSQLPSIKQIPYPVKLETSHDRQEVLEDAIAEFA